MQVFINIWLPVSLFIKDYCSFKCTLVYLFVLYVGQHKHPQLHHKLVYVLKCIYHALHFTLFHPYSKGSASSAESWPLTSQSTQKPQQSPPPSPVSAKSFLLTPPHPHPHTRSAAVILGWLDHTVSSYNLFVCLDSTLFKE